MAKTMKKDNDTAMASDASKRHVYGVHGLTEWHAVIKAGKASVRIPFTGGTITGYGCTPALFATHSEALAKIIEQSDFFLQQRIVKLT